MKDQLHQSNDHETTVIIATYLRGAAARALKYEVDEGRDKTFTIMASVLVVMLFIFLTLFVYQVMVRTVFI